MKNVFLILPVWVPPSTSTFQHERIDQPSPTEVEVEYSTTYTSLQHPTTVLLFHVYHIYTQQLFNFQKIIFLLIPPHPVGLPPVFSSTFWLHIHPTAGMEKGGMSAILCNRSLWSHFCSSKIYMRPPWTLLNCIWRFSTLQRRYLTFGDISVRWRWVKWFSKNSF